MPKGVYDRSKSKPRKTSTPPMTPATPPASTNGAQEPAKEPAPRKPRAASPAKGERARFGVFEDGSVLISTARCDGSLEPEEAQALFAFMKRIGVVEPA